MSAKGELLELMGKIQNIIEVYEHDPIFSEFEEDPHVIEILNEVFLVIQVAFPAVQLSQDLIYGEITPHVFTLKWEQLGDSFRSEGGEEIGPEVAQFLDKMKKNSGDEV